MTAQEFVDLVLKSETELPITYSEYALIADAKFKLARMLRKCIEQRDCEIAMNFEMKGPIQLKDFAINERIKLKTLELDRIAGEKE
jgi:hypothetical protein